KMDEDDDIFDEFERGEEEVGVMDSTDTPTVDGNVGHSSGQSTMRNKCEQCEGEKEKKGSESCVETFCKNSEGRRGTTCLNVNIVGVD
ncbi:hypothetical protein Dimus_037402, partial [Dionaea muscipula]